MLVVLRCKGALKQRTNVSSISVAASQVEFITEAKQYVSRYSSWEIIHVAFLSLTYSASRQWIAAAVYANVLGVRDWKYWNVVGWHPMLLAVKKNWQYAKTSTSISLYHDMWSSIPLESYTLSNRCSFTWIWSSVCECKSNYSLWSIVEGAPSANHS
jgi:hypothetical protein